jgi:glycosyltransferase involved in cell wall biosynthesis
MESASERASGGGRLRIATVYRNFNELGSIHSLYRRNTERLAHDEQVTAFCSKRTRQLTSAPVDFEDVEPLVAGLGRATYALECATFAIAATRRIARLRHNFDVVHVEGYAAMEADLVTAHAVRPAEIAHYFDQVEPGAWIRQRLSPRFFSPQSQVVKLIERRLLGQPCPLVLTPTKAIADELEAWYGVPKDHIEVLPFGINTSAFRHDAEARAQGRTELGARNHQVAILFVGGDFALKGLDRALQGIAASRTDSVFWVAGRDDPSRAERLAAELGIADRVRFLGWRSPADLQKLYAACDVVLQPSRRDSWGHVVIEGLAAGCVVVASDEMGSSNAIEDGRSGYVLRDHEDVSEQIAVLLDGPLADREKRDAIGAAAQLTARAYDTEAIYPRFRDAHYRAHELRLSREPSTQSRPRSFEGAASQARRCKRNGLARSTHRGD